MFDYGSTLNYRAQQANAVDRMEVEERIERVRTHETYVFVFVVTPQRDCVVSDPSRPRIGNSSV